MRIRSTGMLQEELLDGSELGSTPKFRNSYPKGPYSVHLWTLIPNTIPGGVFGTRVLQWAVKGPFGLGPHERHEHGRSTP